MKIDQIPYGQIELLRLRWSASGMDLPGAIVPGTEAVLLYAERESKVMLRVGGEVLGVEGDGRKNEELLSDLCTRNFPRIAWVVDAGQQSLTIQVHTFLKSLPVPPIELCVDEKAFEALERIDRKLRAPERALKWLEEQFLLNSKDGMRGFVTADSAAGNCALSFYGRTRRIFIRKAKRADQSDALLVDKLVPGRGQGGEQLALLSGDIRFVDATVAGRLRADAAAQLSSLVTSGSSFLDIWNRYGQIENEAALDRARKIGVIKYDHVESLPDGRYRIALAADCTLEKAEKFRQALSEEQGISIETLAEVPEVLTREMTWEEYEALPRPTDFVSPASFTSKVTLIERDRTLILTKRRGDDTAPPDSGFLVASLQGDKKRLERRSEAEKAIREARCPMPQLGLLLEGRDIEPPRYGAIEPMSPSVKKKVFGSRSPTPTQEKAIGVALNTPDIALIQGPPGTGKTTVIVALVERLQQIWDSSDGVQGRLLLSGFQHDAVENAIQRMSVNGLPAIKFGNRPNSGDDDRVDMTISRWSQERSAEIRKFLPPRPASALQREVSTVKQSYVMAPGTMEQTAAMLRGIAKSVMGVVSESLADLVITLAQQLDERARLAIGDDPELERLVRCVRALRVDTTAFADDGPRNAYRLSQELASTEYLDDQGKKVLEIAARWPGHESAPPFLDELRVLRRKLLLKLQPADRTKNAVPRIREDVLEILSEVEGDLEQRFSRSRDAADEAIWNFLEALESDPEAVKLAVISYTSVFAATCQQSARKELSQLKGGESYDTVVVDEAARANPLDLFIPLAKAKRRIVLVGDHRQLPHIIDQKLERELEEVLASSQDDVEQQTSNMLKESLFERLFNDLKQREEKDKITRTVTLDEQYRMHPTLGKFVSEQFYTPYGEGFRSPSVPDERTSDDDRKHFEEEYLHTFPEYAGSVAWLRVPRSLGEEYKDKKKKTISRQIEARVLVAELKRLMDSQEGRGLTFGVISFYKEQVKLLETELISAGMAVKYDDEKDDPAEILDPYRELIRPNGRVTERLRFGTVDAFQGMEFDVVFLSMVRCNHLLDNTEIALRRKYGHLMLPNRTCVAMSRQKKLLIAVGDDGMFNTFNAKKAVGPLVAFLSLCSEIKEVHDASRI